MSLKRVLLEAAVTQAQLAEAIGTTRARVNRWANGKVVPRQSMRLVIAHVLGIPLDELEKKTGWNKNHNE